MELNRIRQSSVLLRVTEVALVGRQQIVVYKQYAPHVFTVYSNQSLSLYNHTRFLNKQSENWRHKRPVEIADWRLMGCPPLVSRRSVSFGGQQLHGFPLVFFPSTGGSTYHRSTASVVIATREEIKLTCFCFF